MKKLLLLAMMPAIMLGGIKNNSSLVVRADEVSTSEATSSAVVPLTPQQACNFIGFTYDTKTGIYVHEIDVNYDSPTSLAKLVESVKAVDPQTNKNVTVTLSSNEQRYPENLKVQKYVLMFSATANDYNAIAKLTINVVDTAKPTIVGPAEVKSGYSNPKTISQILSMYYVKDNADADIALQVENDNYTANRNKLGSYKMTLVATDKSKNSISRDITINVVDDAAPVLTAPAKIYKNTATILTVSDIEKYVSAYDEIDGDLAATIKDDQFTGYGNKEGTYQVIFSAKDKAGNASSKTVEVVVTADIKGNGYLVDDTTLVTFNDVLLKDTEIVSFLTAADIVDGTQQNYITVTADTYTAGYENTGVYAYELKVRSTAGVEKLVAIDIEVKEAESGTLVEGKTFWQKIGDFFTKLWHWICGKGWTL